MKSSIRRDRLRFRSPRTQTCAYYTPLAHTDRTGMNTRGVSVLGLGIGVARSSCVAARPLVRARSAVATPKRFKTTTSFWSTSYPTPVQDAAADKVPTPPPLPAPSAVTQTEESDRQRARRQQRYLDSLMNKAGEVGLQCKSKERGRELTPGSILDANGNWTAEEGKYRKMDLCRAHDLDVSHTCFDRRAQARYTCFNVQETTPTVLIMR